MLAVAAVTVRVPSPLRLINSRIAIARAEGLLGQVPPDAPLAHYRKGQLLRAQRRYADAIPEFEAAIPINRNSAGAYATLASSKLFTGSLEEVVPLVHQAIRLSPRDPDLGFWYNLIGLTDLLQSRTDEAIVWLEKARTAQSGTPIHPRSSRRGLWNQRRNRTRRRRTRRSPEAKR